MGSGEFRAKKKAHRMFLRPKNVLVRWLVVIFFFISLQRARHRFIWFGRLALEEEEEDEKSAEHTRGGEAQKEFGLIIVERRVLESSEKRNMKNHKTSIR